MRSILKLCLIIFISVRISSIPAEANENQDRRTNIGLRLFRTLLASDQHLHKKLDTEQHLPLFLIYLNDHASAQHYVQKLLTAGREQQQGKIHGFPMKVLALPVSRLSELSGARIAGIFILEKLTPEHLQYLLNLSVDKQVIVYSPFEGDVQAGVPAGLDVGVRVRPFINMKAMENANISIKDLFLKVSKRYEN